MRHGSRLWFTTHGNRRGYRSPNLTYGGRQGRGDHGRRHHTPAWSGTHGPGSATIWSKGRGHYPDIRLAGRKARCFNNGGTAELSIRDTIEHLLSTLAGDRGEGACRCLHV